MTDATNTIALSQARLTTGGMIGNVMEWYDFTIYGFFAATIGKLFFPSDHAGVSLMAAFGVFAVGFFIRPLGAVVFGYVGDLVGRKRVLILTVALMAVSTTLIGVLPTYAEIGIAAPLLLVLLRIIQGLSASGELAGSLVYLIESGPTGKRGFMGSLSTAGGILANVLGSLVGALISVSVSTEALEVWGWRLPFLAGSILGIFGLILRRNFPELPRQGERAASPVVEMITGYRKQLLQGIGIAMLWGAAFVLIFIYIVTWLRQQTHEPHAEILAINSISLLVLAAALTGFARLSDRIGRKPLLLFGSGGLVVFAYPLLWLMHHENAALILSGQIGFALLIGAVAGLVPTTLAELFPWRIRVSATGVAFNVSFALFGGTAPVVVAWLVTRTGEAMVIAWYLMALALLAFIAALTLRETKDAPLVT